MAETFLTDLDRRLIAELDKRILQTYVMLVHAQNQMPGAMWTARVLLADSQRHLDELKRLQAADVAQLAQLKELKALLAAEIEELENPEAGHG